MKKRMWSILGTLLVGLIVYYLFLPPINLTSISFWVFLVFLVTTYYFLSLPIQSQRIVLTNTEIKLPGSKVLMAVWIGVPAVLLLINFVLSPFFNATAYSQRITIDETKEFSDDVEEVNFKAIPLLDKASSRKLGDRTMGQITDLVSQFVVSDLYAQINYNDDIVRVTPLEYASIIKYFTNRSEGVEGYITVDSVNGESKLVRLDKGMKYMPSAYFFEDLYRKLRIEYPTTIFGKENFEIDEDGNPYWIVPTIKYVGIGLRKEISGVVVLNPINGETKKYKVGEIPNWIDHVYDSELILEQINNWGTYRNGFWNSIFGQKNVVNATEGYNYLAMEGDVYLYTGITSVSTDESNLGFILTNMRTKETNYYVVPGAEEYSAMASAEGLVQEKKYIATFPLLINLNGKPTYLLSLKDNAGLVKMYAFVDVVDYQKVITSDAALGIEAAATKYLGEAPANPSSDVKEATIQIKTKTEANIDGNTFYYLTDKGGNKYSVSIKVADNFLPFLMIGDKITVNYYENADIRVISDIVKP